LEDNRQLKRPKAKNKNLQLLIDKFNLEVEKIVIPNKK